MINIYSFEQPYLSREIKSQFFPFVNFCIGYFNFWLCTTVCYCKFDSYITDNRFVHHYFYNTVRSTQGKSAYSICTRSMGSFKSCIRRCARDCSSCYKFSNRCRTVDSAWKWISYFRVSRSTSILKSGKGPSRTKLTCLEGNWCVL